MWITSESGDRWSDRRSESDNSCCNIQACHHVAGKAPWPPGHNSSKLPCTSGVARARDNFHHHHHGYHRTYHHPVTYRPLGMIDNALEDFFVPHPTKIPTPTP